MRPRLALTLALALTAAVALPATAWAADVPPGAAWSQATFPSTDGVQLHADILRPKHLAATDKTPVILSIGPYFNHAGQTGAVGPVQGTTYDPLGPSTGPSERFYDFVNGAPADGARLHVRDGRPARLRRLERLPGLGRTGRAGGRRGGRQVGGVAAVVDRQRRHVRQVLRRRHRADRRQQASRGPEGRRLSGAGLRPLPLPLRRRHPARERAADAGAVRPDRRHAGPARRHADESGLQRQWRQRHDAAGLQGRQLGRPGRQQRPLLPLLARAHPDPRRRRVGRPAVSHPGADREQHGRRRDGAVPAQPHRLRARLARPVGARARQRDRRERPPEDGPRRDGSTRSCASTTASSRAPSRRSPTRRWRCRPTTASGAPRKRGRRPTRPSSRARCAPAPTRTTAPPTRPARAPRRACGRSRRRCPYDAHLSGSGKADRRRVDGAAEREPRASTSTTSTRTAAARWSPARAT